VQFIKVFALVTAAGVSKAVKQLARELSRYTKKYCCGEECCGGGYRSTKHQCYLPRTVHEDKVITSWYKQPADEKQQRH
jgi:hypothetical protein